MPPSISLSLATCFFQSLPIMDFIRASSNAPAEYDCMVKIELEAAEALAGLAHFPTNNSESRCSASVAERVKDESNSSFDTFPKCSSNSYENHNFMVKKAEKSGGLSGKLVKDEQNTELRLNPRYHTNCGRKSRQNLTEAEMEARKIRRVLANRESARQTIRRRQAVFEELTRKAVDLSWENENLKREKDKSLKKYDSLKTKNECLKAQMIKIINKEAEETREEYFTTNEPSVAASSTSSPFVIYNQPPLLPFVWPNAVQLQCGPPAGIVFPSHVPITAANKPDSSSREEGAGGGGGTPLYLVPYPWVVTLPQTSNENCPHSFNLNDKPKEEQFFPEKIIKSELPPTNGFPPDGGGRGHTKTDSVSCEELIEHDTCNTFLKEQLKGTRVGEKDQINVHKIHQVPVVCSGKRLGDNAAATEARKRRKQLTRLKNHYQCRQLRMH